MRIRFYKLSALTAAQRADLLKRTETDLTPFKEEVRPIIESVRAQGDEALVFYARRFERASLTPSTLRVSPAGV